MGIEEKPMCQGAKSAKLMLVLQKKGARGGEGSAGSLIFGGLYQRGAAAGRV